MIEDKHDSRTYRSLKESPVASFKKGRPLREGGLFCTRGKVVVEIDLPEEKRGEILLPGEVAEDCMPDVGTVIATGEADYHKGRVVPMPKPGERVLVLPKHGKSIEGLVRSGESYEGFTRFYGCAGGFSPYKTSGEPGHMAFRAPWWVSIVAELQDGGTFVPKGDWVLLKHELNEATDGGILVSGLYDRRVSCKGEVIATGPLCEDVQGREGSLAVYHEGASKHVYGLSEEYVIVREGFIYALID